jgi:hypothetical protein
MNTPQEGQFIIDFQLSARGLRIGEDASGLDERESSTAGGGKCPSSIQPSLLPKLTPKNNSGMSNSAHAAAGGLLGLD